MFTGSDGMMGVDYAKLVPPLIGAMQELERQNRGLERQNEDLEHRLMMIERKLGLPQPAASTRLH